MDVKLVSKKNMGVIATIILVILLSQSRYFNFLINSTLGRAILILFILGISYTNKILGSVAVLAIIIMFNQHGMQFMEGFTEPPSSNTRDNKNSDVYVKKHKLAKAVKDKSDTVLPSAVAASNHTETLGGREGFNISEKEALMLRGKRANEIPVLPSARSQSEDVEPAEKEVFSSYAAF